MVTAFSGRGQSQGECEAEKWAWMWTLQEREEARGEGSHASPPSCVGGRQDGRLGVCQGFVETLRGYDREQARDEHRDPRGPAEFRRLNADGQLGAGIPRSTWLKDKHHTAEHHGGDNFRSQEWEVLKCWFADLELAGTSGLGKMGNETDKRS